MIPFWHGNLVAICLLLVCWGLVTARFAVVAAALLAVLAVLIGPTPLTRTLDVRAGTGRPPPAETGTRLHPVDLPEGHYSFRIAGSRTPLWRLGDNGFKYHLRADLREFWPPLHASAVVEGLCGSQNGPCPPEILLFPGGTAAEQLRKNVRSPAADGRMHTHTVKDSLSHDGYSLQAIDVGRAADRVEIRFSASRAATAKSDGRVLTIDPGPIRPSIFGIAAWLSAFGLIAIAIRRRHESRGEYPTMAEVRQSLEH